VPIELVRTEIKNKKKVSSSETEVIIKETAKPPQDRMRNIEISVNKSGLISDPILREAQVEVDFKMLELNGRV
jgi:hypothetical protein